MKCFWERKGYKTTPSTDVLDITKDVEEFVARSGLKEGLVTVFVPGSTASITTIEFETGVINDLKRAIEELIPKDRHYMHDSRWGDGNGYSHVRASFLKPSLSIPVMEGKLSLGPWQQVVLIDFDNKSRTREVIFQIL